MMVLRSVSVVPSGTRGGRGRLCEGKSKEASNGIGGGLLISRSAGNKSNAGQAWISSGGASLFHPCNEKGRTATPDGVADSPFGSYAPDVSYSSGAATHAFRFWHLDKKMQFQNPRKTSLVGSTYPTSSVFGYVSCKRPKYMDCTVCSPACLHRWAFGGAVNGGSASFSCRQWKYGACKKYRIGVLAQQVTPVEGSR